MPIKQNPLKIHKLGEDPDHRPEKEGIMWVLNDSALAEP